MDIQPIQIAPVTDPAEDLERMVRELKPGVYVFSDLYDKYMSMVIQDGRTGVGRRLFGRTIRQAGYAPGLAVVGGRGCRVYHIFPATPTPCDTDRSRI